WSPAERSKKDLCHPGYCILSSCSCLHPVYYAAWAGCELIHQLRAKLSGPLRNSRMNNDAWVPISHENCHQVSGPFYHGTKAKLAIGDLLTTGHSSHFEAGRVLKHMYF